MVHPASRVSADPSFLAGRILIAMPGIDDERFARSVMLVCVHDSDQAMAITLNRPVEGLTLPGVLAKLGIDAGNVPEEPVLSGGPVERARGHVVHTSDFLSPGSTIMVADDVGMTTTRDVLDAMTDTARRPRHSLLALGYAGWSAGQLERELQQNVWLVCDPDEDLVFGHDFEAKWAHALSKIGASPDKMSAAAGRA